MIDYLYNVSKEFGISLTDNMLERFQIFYDILMEKNKVMNLTAITDEKEVVLKHFVDSIALIKYISLDCERLIDVGTGAGFPGIPLAIVCDNAQITLMDSLNKRIEFLNEVIDKCGLENVKTIHSRAEDLGREKDYREQYDIVVSRAVANLSVLLEYCMPFSRVGGKFISYKSVLADEEIQKSYSAQKKLHTKMIERIDYQIPQSEFSRNFLIFEKIDKLDMKYPRQVGKPKRNPL